MTTISMLTIDGIIDPSMGCVPCGMESRIYTQSPIIHSDKSDDELDDLIYLNDHFETFCPDNKDSVFWKKRTLTYMQASPSIVSMAFIPTDKTKCQILFVQKMSLEPNVTGFVAPYLSKKDRQHWGAVSTIPICYSIHDDQTINQSIRWLSGEVHSTVQTILGYFLKDRQSRFLGLTLLVEPKKYISLGWVKA